MLRRQTADSTPMSFLAGNGEMAQRIRAFAWAGHPLGPPESWPQSLRSALGICLNSAFPTAIYWGPELRLLYNDAWSHIPGPRHPGCLGEPCKVVWADIWHIIEPQFEEVIATGEGLFVDDQLLPMRRHGIEEETYWSYSFTPIRGEDGKIEGIFNSGQETTAKVLKQRQTVFLLRLIDTLRRSADASALMNDGCRLLGEHLGAIRVGIRERGKSLDGLDVTVEWTAEGTAKAGHGVPWSSLGSIARRLEAGHAVRIERTTGDAGSDTQALHEIGARSVLALPWLQSGGLSTVLYVHRDKAQPWTDEDVATAEQVFGRLVQAIERERSKEREQAMSQEIDHRARNMLGISQAIIRMTRADDVESFRKSLLERTRALGNTLQVLSAADWEGADLADLLRKELAPFTAGDEARTSIKGPRVMVPPLKAQPVSMALHELVTNAVKYGGLSSAEGSLDVIWAVRADRTLEVDWRESHVQPAIAEKRERSGFGTKLLEMTIERQLGGSYRREISGGTFLCRFEIPLSTEN